MIFKVLNYPRGSIWMWWKEEAINCHNQTPDGLDDQKPLSDFKRTVARLGDSRHQGFSLHNKAHTENCRSLWSNSKTHITIY